MAVPKKPTLRISSTNLYFSEAADIVPALGTASSQPFVRNQGSSGEENRPFATAGWNAAIDFVQAELARPAFAGPFQEEAIVEAHCCPWNVEKNGSLVPTCVSACEYWTPIRGQCPGRLTLMQAVELNQRTLKPVTTQRGRKSGRPWAPARSHPLVSAYAKVERTSQLVSLAGWRRRQADCVSFA